MVHVPRPFKSCLLAVSIGKSSAPITSARAPNIAKSSGVFKTTY